MNQEYSFCPFCRGKFEKLKTETDGIWRLICSECGYTIYDNPNPTVFALIIKDNQILLNKRKFEPHKGLWDLPGGFVEVGQNLEAALAQEIKEELGVGVKSAEYFNSSVSEYPTKYRVENVVGIAFKVEVDSYDFTPGSDALEVKFFDLNNLPELAPFKDVKETMQKLFKERKNA